MLLSVPALPNPVASKQAVATTTIIIEVENMAGDPVIGAPVKLIVNGISISKWSTKTVQDMKDKTAKVTLSFPTTSVQPTTAKGIFLNFHMEIVKGRLQAHENGVVVRNKKTHFLIVLEPIGKARGTPEERRKNRSKYPTTSRSQRELLDDLVYAAKKTNKVLKTTEVLVHFKHHAKHDALQEIVKSLDLLSTEPVNKTTLAEVELLASKSKALSTASKVLTPATVGITIVTGLYDFIDAVESDDPVKATVAFADTAFAIGATLVPAAMPVYLGLHLGFGLAKLLAANPSSISENVVDAVSRQNKIPSLNHVGSCPVSAGDKHYRLEKDGHTWRCKSYQYSVPGLAFADRDIVDGRRVQGALVIVNSTGDETLVARDTMSDAELDRLYKEIQNNKNKL